MDLALSEYLNNTYFYIDCKSDEASILVLLKQTPIGRFNSFLKVTIFPDTQLNGFARSCTEKKGKWHSEAGDEFQIGKMVNSVKRFRYHMPFYVVYVWGLLERLDFCQDVYLEHQDASWNYTASIVWPLTSRIKLANVWIREILKKLWILFSQQKSWNDDFRSNFFQKFINTFARCDTLVCCLKLVI